MTEKTKNRWAKFVVPQMSSRKRKPPIYNRDFNNIAMHGTEVTRSKIIREMKDFSKEELQEIADRYGCQLPKEA